MATPPERPYAMMPRSAMVMAAGFGTRMQPLTLTTPKPMLKLGGKPLIDYALDHMEAAGIETVVVNLHYLGDQIRDHVGRRGMKGLHFQPEDTVLETGGSALMALPVLGEDRPFFVFNADTVYLNGPKPGLQRLADRWDDDIMDVLLMTIEIPQNEVPDFIPGVDGRITFGVPDKGPGYSMRAVSLIHPRLFAEAPTGMFALNQLWRKAAANGRLFGLEHDGLCYHLSTPEDLRLANIDLRQRGLGERPDPVHNPSHPAK